MVEQLAAWYETHRLELEERGIRTWLGRSPYEGRPKASAWLTMQRGGIERETDLRTALARVLSLFD